jgi:tetratricopeptide (TPR) repeat protein
MKSSRFSLPGQSSFLQRDWFLAIALLFVTLIAYSPAWNGRPIWDDNEHLTRSDLRSLHGLAQIWTQLGSTQQYYPVVHTVFWVQHRIWGGNPLGYHLTNILLHVASALLLVKILKELKIPGRWFAGAVVALHPVQVESVAWMSELKNTLSGLFFLSSLFFYLRFDRSRSLGAYVAAFGLFFLGLLAKSVIAILPAIILVILWWKRGKLSWKRDLLPLVPFFAIGIGIGLFTAWVERNFVGAQGSAFNLSVIQRVLIAGRAFWFYLSKLFWPTNLIFIYPRWAVDAAVWWEYFFPSAAVVLFIALWMLRRKSRGPLAAFLFFVGMLFPVLGFLNVYPFIYSFVADHFQYLACIGIITLTASSLSLAIDVAPPPIRRIGIASGFILISVLAALSWRQAHLYQDEETLWRVTLSRNPDCWMAQNNLGDLLLDNGRIDEAVARYEQSLVKRPNPEKAQYNLALAFVAAGEIDKAIEHYRRALEIKPDYADAHYNLGGAFARNGRVDEAIEEYQKTLELRPTSADAHNNLGSAFLEKGRVVEAIEQYQVALQLRSDDSGIEYNLGHAFAQEGELDQAIAHYQKALAIQPDYTDAQYELAGAFLQNRQLQDAIAGYEKLLKIHPDHIRARTNLGNLLLQKGDTVNAVGQYEKSLAIAPQDVAALTNLSWVLATCPDKTLRNGTRALDLSRSANRLSSGTDPFVLHSLAAAYAEVGQFSEAIETAQEALRLSSQGGDDGLTKALSKEMEFYKARLPYRKNGE